MPVVAKLLTAAAFRQLMTAPPPPAGKVRHSDGGGLYIVRDHKGFARWAFKYKSRTERNAWGAKPVELGLGSATVLPAEGALTLAKAREKAEGLRQMLRDGVDPANREPIRPAAIVAALTPAGTTFGTFADEHLPDIIGNLKNDKSAAQWRRHLTETAAPIRDKLIRDITTPDIVNLVAPIIRETPESGKRLIKRIEAVMALARTMGEYTGHNPAQWKGNLDAVPSLKVGKSSENQPAIPFEEMRDFMTLLRFKSDVSARALDFCILTAARTNEVLGARWDEIDGNVWTIPAIRMKKGRDHKVPLSADALAILEQLKPINGKRELIFANVLSGKRMSDMAMLQMLRGIRDGRELVGTVHGCRASFSTWANEQRGADGKAKYDTQVIEFCLAHVNKDRTEAAYNRSEALEARRVLLTDWSGFLNG